MKRLLLIMLFPFLLCSGKDPHGITWYSLKDGLELAARENKPVFLFLNVAWCDKCQRMGKKIFTDAEVLPLIMEKYVPVSLNPETDTAYFKNDELMDRKVFLTQVEPGKYAVMVPTTVLYKGKESAPLVMQGLIDPGQLKENLLKFLVQ